MALSGEERAACLRLDRQFAAIRDLPPPLPENRRKTLRIAQLQSGGYLKIRERTYRVMGRLQIRGQSIRRNEAELFCLENGQDHHLVWEKNDRVALSLNAGALALEAVGSSPIAFAEIIETRSGTLSFGGREFAWAGSHVAERVRVGVRKAKPRSVHCYEFVSGNAKIVVECADVDENEPPQHEAHLLESMPAAEVEILFAKG